MGLDSFVHYLYEHQCYATSVLSGKSYKRQFIMDCCVALVRLDIEIHVYMKIYSLSIYIYIQYMHQIFNQHV